MTTHGFANRRERFERQRRPESNARFNYPAQTRMTRTLTIIGTILSCALLFACGGSSGGSNGTDTSPTDTVITAVSITAVSSSSATLSFSTTPASDAGIRVWLDTDDAAAQAQITIASDNAVNHSVTLDALWSATPWRAEIEAGNSSASTVFTTANPEWPAACRSGDIELPINGAGSWSIYTDINGSVAVEAVAGCEGAGSGARLSFDLGDGEWVVAASNDNFAAPLDLSAYSHLWVPFRGTAGVPVRRRRPAGVA
jgi:hypothetical protein